MIGLVPSVMSGQLEQNHSKKSAPDAKRTIGMEVLVWLGTAAAMTMTDRSHRSRSRSGSSLKSQSPHSRGLVSMALGAIELESGAKVGAYPEHKSNVYSSVYSSIDCPDHLFFHIHTNHYQRLKMRLYGWQKSSDASDNRFGECTLIPSSKAS